MSTDAFRQLAESMHDPRATHTYHVVVSAVDTASATCTVDDGASGTLTAVPYVGAAPSVGQSVMYFVSGDHGVVMGGDGGGAVNYGLQLFDGSNVMVGPGPPSPPILVQTGTAVGIIEAGFSGFWFTFPKPFPHGVISVIIMDAAFSAGGNKSFSMDSAQATKAKIPVSVFTPAGGGFNPGNSIGFTYIVIGW